MVFFGGKGLHCECDPGMPLRQTAVKGVLERSSSRRNKIAGGFCDDYPVIRTEPLPFGRNLGEIYPSFDCDTVAEGFIAFGVIENAGIIGVEVAIGARFEDIGGTASS